MALQGDVKAAETIKGKLCTASPHVKHMPKLPKSGTPEYAELLIHLGVPKELAESGRVSPRHNGMVDYVTELHEEGKPLPPHVHFAYPDYRCTYRTKKGPKTKE